MDKTKKRFSRAYVIADSAKLAYNIAKKLSITPNNFYFIRKKEDLIKKCSSESLILVSNSFSKKNKDYDEIKAILKSEKFSKAIILTEKEFQERAYTDYKKVDFL